MCTASTLPKYFSVEILCLVEREGVTDLNHEMGINQMLNGTDWVSSILSNLEIEYEKPFYSVMSILVLRRN